MGTRIVATTSATLLASAFALVPALAQGTSRISLDSAGIEANRQSEAVSLSLDGRFVAFVSQADNLVAGDTNARRDVFVRDRLTGITERVSISSTGAQANDGSDRPSISANGRFVVFDSDASNLVAGDTNGRTDVFLRDRQTGSTERVSVDSNGAQGDDLSFPAAVSGDGRFVAFQSRATNLVAGDTNLFQDIFVRDRQSGTTERVSVDSAGVEGNGASFLPVLSADGRFVAFNSNATNLAPGIGNWTGQALLRDRQLGTTEVVSLDGAGVVGHGSSRPSGISADGRFVAFESDAPNLVTNDTNARRDAFVRDRQSATTERVSRNSSGVQGDGHSFTPVLSADGRWVAFSSSATNLDSGDTNGRLDVFLHDRSNGTTKLASRSTTGTLGDGDSTLPALSADGRFVAFSSRATNLVAGDTNASPDDFVRGAALTLEADPATPMAGATLTFSTWTGAALAPALLVVSEVNGAPVFLPVVLGAFDPAGAWSLSATVPPGLAGVVITLETFGIVPSGKVNLSNPFAVAFQ